MVREKLFDTFRSRSVKFIVFPLSVLLLFYCVGTTIVVLDRNKAIDGYSQQLADSVAENKEFQTETENLQSELNAVHDRIRDAENEIQKMDYDHSIETKELRDQINELYAHGWFDYEVSKDSIALADTRLDPILIEMLEKHFDALYSGDLETYKSTLKQGADEENLTSHVKSRAIPAKVKVVASYIMDPVLMAEFNQKGGISELVVMVAVADRREKAPTIDTYHVGVTKETGEWQVYGYD